MEHSVASLITRQRQLQATRDKLLAVEEKLGNIRTDDDHLIERARQQQLAAQETIAEYNHRLTQVEAELAHAKVEEMLDRAEEDITSSLNDLTNLS